MKKAPFIQIKYTGVDILAMGAMMIEEEWRTDVIELFESARKVKRKRSNEEACAALHCQETFAAQ